MGNVFLVLMVCQAVLFVAFGCLFVRIMNTESRIDLLEAKLDRLTEREKNYIDSTYAQAITLTVDALQKDINSVRDEMKTVEEHDRERAESEKKFFAGLDNILNYSIGTAQEATRE